MLCDRQLRASMGVIGLDWNVVIKVAGTMKIDIDKKFYRMLKAFENVLIEEINAKK